MASMIAKVPVCRATIEDIGKALREKPKLTQEDVRKRLPDQIKDFAQLFADDSGAEDLPRTRGSLDHVIDLRHENGKPLIPPWGPLYNMSREELLVLRKTLTDLLAKGWIRPSSSSAAAPVLFARKPSGGLRFCVDYRGLNAITIPDRYPLPLFRETLRQHSKARWFTKLDVKSAFYRVRIIEGDEWMTAFRCRLGLFEWLVTSFGLINAPATFQRYINEHLREHLDLDATACIDDILAYNDGSVEGHWKTVRSIQGKLDKAGLYLDIDKCEFLCKQVKYLEFIVRAGQGITVDPAKVKAILEWKAPNSRIFGNSSAVDRFDKKDTPWVLRKIENNAFNKLKEIFATEPVLAQWDPDRETVLEADSSGYAIGGCLSQVNMQGRLRPVAYLSRRLDGAEPNYPFHDKEMLSIIACLQEWQPELPSVAKPFTILSDHKNLSFFTTKRLLSERQVRYNDVLQQFRFNLRWRPGRACDRPDALSRRDQDRPHGIEDERTAGRILQLLPTVPLYPVQVQGQQQEIKETNNESGSEIVADEILLGADRAGQANIFDDTELQALWKEGVENDNDWRRARNAVRAGERSFPPDLAIKMTANIAECAVTADDVLHGRDNRIWVLDYEPLRTAIMQKTHDRFLTGHPGRDTMIDILLRR
ncbi:hypothetical protein K3495_g9572 [Podosphaera aphanis]|nr:hypothetical protein K3495_g9572 [Podosphaera aphanis]